MSASNVVTGKGNQGELRNCVADQRGKTKLQVHSKTLGKAINVAVHATKLLTDEKMHSSLTGLGGAFCCLCTDSEQQCNDIECISAGFKVSQSLEEIADICQ